MPCAIEAYPAMSFLSIVIRNCAMHPIRARCQAPLSPCSVQSFSVNARSTACKRAITNLDNAQRALSNLLIASMRLTHHNRYETNYAPNVPYIKNTTS